MVQDKSKIYVLSYLQSCIAISTRNRNLKMEASDGITPSRELFTMEEIEYINDHSPVFRLGMLEFSESERDELNDALHINPEKCLYERDIDDLLLRADKEALARIIAINDAQTIGRVRGHAAMLSARIPNRVVDVVNYRYNEIRSGQRNSKIVIEKVPQHKEDLRDQQMAQMQKEMEAMRQMLAQFMQGGVVASVELAPAPSNIGADTEEAKRRGGRPRKNSVE